ncbi:MAG: HAD family hydrolase [Candidatus Omnitrophica bacterium]|nr:HAD family hydrolase [Candidatus Omnitrophota bacterium]
MHRTKSSLSLNLREYRRNKEYLVAIDTDGCIVDNMNGKQILIFHPLYMEFYNLWEIESYFRETAEYFNLFSVYRGSNRFITIVLTLKELKKRQDVRKYAEKINLSIPDFQPIERFIHFCEENGYGLSNISLGKYLEKNIFDFGIHKLLGWSRAVNELLPQMNKLFVPFKNVKESLQFIKENADICVVSQTPYNDLYEYWEFYGILGFLNTICSQETGNKTDQVKILKETGGYCEQNILVIGDSYTDLQAAKTNNASFYPIIPGREEESWEKFPEIFRLFLSGNYSKHMQTEYINEFSKTLSSIPAWEKSDYDHQSAYKERQQLRKSLYEKYNPEGRLLLL